MSLFPKDLLCTWQDRTVNNVFDTLVKRTTVRLIYEHAVFAFICVCIYIYIDGESHGKYEKHEKRKQCIE